MSEREERTGEIVITLKIEEKCIENIPIVAAIACDPAREYPGPY